MKWYMNEKLISLLQYYAKCFPVHSQLKELNHLAINIDALPVSDLFADKIDHEGFWQKIINFFKGASRVEMTQFDQEKEIDKWELSELEDEMLRILSAGMDHKRDKLLKMRSGKKSSGDSQLFAMKLIEYILVETINKARSERMRIEIYERLINLIKKMIVDFSHRYFNGWLIQMLELSIEKLDEMIEFEESQKNLRAFQDSVNGIRLGTFVRQLNEDVMASLIPDKLDDNVYNEAARVNLAGKTYDEFIHSELYGNVAKPVRKLLKDENNYNLIRDGWLSNARHTRLFQSRLDEEFLFRLAKQRVKREDIIQAIKARSGRISRRQTEELADKYEAVFIDLNRLYILSGMLSLIKKQSTYLGQSATILYQKEVSEWFRYTLNTFDALKDDLKELAVSNKIAMPYLNRQEGRGLFLTSSLNRNIEEVRLQILQAKRYMHVNKERLKDDHNEFLKLINVGIDCLNMTTSHLDSSEAERINDKGVLEKSTSNRYQLFKEPTPERRRRRERVELDDLSLESLSMDRF